MHEKNTIEKKSVSYAQHDLGIPETVDSTMKHLGTFTFLSFHSDIYLEKNRKVVGTNSTISHAHRPSAFSSELC